MYCARNGLVHNVLGVLVTPSLLIDTECYCITKIGSLVNVSDYLSEIESINYDYSKELKIVQLPDKNLSADQQATVLNYFWLCSGVPHIVKWFLQDDLPQESVVAWITDLQNRGY